MAVVGPTASGKTELAVALAEQLQGELLSADSRQVFRGCDIGTNKPTPVELRGIPCHLLDLVQPGERFTVADYRQAALAAIDRVAGHGHLPIFQGGTGLYLRAVFEGWNLAGAPPDPQTRAALELRLEEQGVEALHAELRQIDPVSADRTQGNPRRIIRALEIHAVTGEPPAWRDGRRHQVGGGSSSGSRCLSTSSIRESRPGLVACWRRAGWTR